jgi:Na+(H+)/acetate symporter ActP
MDRLRLAEQAKAMDQTRLQSEIALKAADSAARRFTAMMRDIVAAAGFALALSVFAYLVFSGANTVAATVMFGSVIASACALFYGKFILVKLRDLFRW